MKLCITATGNDLSASTESAFGRAPWFVLVDTDSGATEAVANTSVNASHGAGIAAAQTMSDNRVDAVLTGRLGPKAQTALAAAGIGMYEGIARTSVGEALEQFRFGKYTMSGSANGAAAGATAAPRSAASSMDRAGQAAGFGFGRGMGGGRGQGGCGCGRNGSGAGRGRGQGGRGQR